MKYWHQQIDLTEISGISFDKFEEMKKAIKPKLIGLISETDNDMVRANLVVCFDLIDSASTEDEFAMAYSEFVNTCNYSGIWIQL